MTCEEFQRLTSDQPEKATNAELMAAGDHYFGCPTCSERMKDGAENFDKEMRENLGPLGFALFDMVSELRVVEIASRVKSDPEYQEKYRCPK